MDRRVLVVDDDPAMLKLLSKYLTAGDYEVLTADNGEDAIGVLHREGPSIVLSDWSMPHMDGIELCRAIRASEGIGFVYIIILTAQSNKDCVVQALDAGANDFLAKPFHRQELLARLNSGMRIICLEADLMRERRELHKINAELSILNRKLELMATTDELTSLANRREAMQRLRSGWSTSVRYHQPFSCIMLDIDHFKQCNDTYGHDVGDLVLKHTAETLQAISRAGELVCRVGGEEFLILCPNSSGQMATQAAERYRKAIAANVSKKGDLHLRVTISAGVATRDDYVANCDELLRYADEALYQAKNAGRNRVASFSAGPAETAKVLAAPV